MPTFLVPIFEYIGGALISAGAVEGGFLVIGAAGYLATAAALLGTLALSQYQKRKAERAARAAFDAAQVDRLANVPLTVAPRVSRGPTVRSVAPARHAFIVIGARPSSSSSRVMHVEVRQAQPAHS